MPVYQYNCKKCNAAFEQIKPSDQAHVLEPCPNCNSDTQQTFAPTPTIFKGDGWTPKK
jgi:putative FmdB family regulatory protein